jgi:hypothetical protein
MIGTMSPDPSLEVIEAVVGVAGGEATLHVIANCVTEVGN